MINNKGVILGACPKIASVARIVAIDLSKKQLVNLEKNSLKFAAGMAISLIFKRKNAFIVLGAMLVLPIFLTSISLYKPSAVYLKMTELLLLATL